MAGSDMSVATLLTLPAAAAPQHLPGALHALESPLNHYGYFAIAGLVFLEDFGVPVPGETVLVLGAVYSINGLVLVLAVGIVYVMANIAVFTFYRREHGDEFNILLHAVFPVVSSVALIYAVYKSFSPAPAHPYNLSPYIDGGWLVIGMMILIVMRARGKEEWLATAGASLADMGEA
ncbi:MAG: hypothetical protein JO325_08590 [Solirubrobacterales bacterium]|nr:hypothetical protein [Solirubrobacterales bacterium]